MMATRSSEEYDLFGVGIEHRRYEGDIGQMSAEGPIRKCILRDSGNN